MKERMSDLEQLKILTDGKQAVSIRVVVHPEDTIDVDPFVISSMKSRLRNDNVSSLYDVTDREFDELQILREKNKLKKVFSSISQLQEAYSSIKSIKNSQQEMAFEGVNRKFLSNYSFILAGEKNVDEYDFYRSFLFGEPLALKNDRANIASIQDIFAFLVEDYRMIHYEPLKITKEAIQISSSLQKLFIERKLASSFDELLSLFYGINP